MRRLSLLINYWKHIKRRILSISLLKYKAYQEEDAKDSPQEETYGIASYKIA
jgi:hypothetical protein